MLFLDGDAEQAEVAELRPQLAREAVLAVDVRGQRRDAFRGELRHGGAQRIEVFTETEIEILHMPWLQCAGRACGRCPIVRQSDQ